jgi:hypothetical protein
MLGALTYDGVMFASETWVTTVNPRTGRPAKPWTNGSSGPNEFYGKDPLGGRDEALIVYALSRDGRARTMAEFFRKTPAGYEYRPFIDSTDVKDVPPMLLGPVSRAWGIHRGSVSPK